MIHFEGNFFEGIRNTLLGLEPPAFTKTVTDVVGWLWSAAATLTPVVSMTVEKERAMRDDALAANMKNFEKEIRKYGQGPFVVTIASEFAYFPSPSVPAVFGHPSKPEAKQESRMTETTSTSKIRFT